MIFSIGLLQLAALLVGALRSKLFASLLGPAGFGIVATIDQLVMSAAQFGNLSVPFAALKFLSHSHSLGDDEFQQSYTSFLRLILGLAVGATLIALVTIPANLGRIDTQIAEYGGTVSLALIGIPAAMLQMFFANVLAAQQRSRQAIVLSTVFAALALVAGGIGCVLGGIRGIYVAIVPSGTMAVLTMIIVMRRRMRPTTPTATMTLRERLKANPQIVTTSFLTYLAVVSASAMMLVARYVSIAHLSAEAAGLLQACIGVALSVGAILGPANTMFFTPHVNRSIPTTEKIAAAESFLPRMALIFCVGALPVVLFPGLVLRVLFSGRFSSAAQLLPWFLAWQCLYHLANVYQQLLIGFDDIRGYTAITVTGNLTTILLSLALVGRFGLTGVGAAFVLGAVVIGVATSLRMRHTHRLRVPARSGVIALFAVASFALISFSTRDTAELTINGAGLRAGVAAGYLVLLWLTLPTSLRTELVSAIRRRRSLANAPR